MHRVTSFARNGRFKAASAALFVVLGVAAYAPILASNFTADDWEYLFILDTSHSVLVCFAPLVERYLRPLVVFLYYANFKAFGLWALPYHLSVVLLHVLNAWLLCLLAVAMDPRRRGWIGILAGVLFTVFGGHTEAVTWIAGVADTLLAPFALGGLLALDRALRAPNPAKWIALVWALFCGGMLVKETCVILPPLFAAYGVAWMIFTPHPNAGGRRAALTRTIAAVSLPAVLLALYLALRAALFGNPVAAYGGLALSGGMMFREARAFVLRSFLPPLDKAAFLWARNLDLIVLAIAVVVVLVVLLRSRENRGAILLAAASLVIALLPALPLTISLSTTETERVVYIASGFGAILTVFVVDSLVRVPAVTMTLVALLSAAHLYMLERQNAHWNEASLTFESVIRSLVPLARAHGAGDGRFVFMLNLPDNVKGAYVFRRGFYASLHFFGPELAGREPTLVGITSHTLQSQGDHIEVRQRGPRAFTLDASPDTFLQLEAPARPYYTFPQWSRSTYALQFTDVVGSATVLHMSEGQMHHTAEISGAGVPFGVIDLPIDGSPCADRMRLTGWALDDEEVTRVAVARDPFPGEGAPGTVVEIGDATWAFNSRPDVAAVYRAFPRLDRSEWDYIFPCSALDAYPGGAARLHVIAIDAKGQRTELGARTIRR